MRKRLGKESASCWCATVKLTTIWTFLAPQGVDARSEARSLLLGDTEGLSGTAGGLGLLTTDLQAEVVTETSVLAGLLHALNVLTETGVNVVGDELAPGAVLDAALSVEEPLGEAVL